MILSMKYILIFLFSLATLSVSGEGINAGVGRKCITPPLPFWLTGYAFRDKPSTEVLHDLWTKAVVFEDRPGNRVAIVTCDLLPTGSRSLMAIPATYSMSSVRFLLYFATACRSERLKLKMDCYARETLYSQQILAGN
jgi:hypothetical protein